MLEKTQTCLIVLLSEWRQISEITPKLTECILGEHGVLQLTEFTHPDGVLSGDSEHVQRPFIERSHGVLQLFDGGVHGLPRLPPHVPLFHHIVGDGGASIAAGSLPLQVSADLGNVGHLQPLRSRWRVW